MGRVRGVHILHSLCAVLVHGPDPGLGHDARSLPQSCRQGGGAGCENAQQAGAVPVRAVLAWLDRLEPSLAQLRESLSAFGRSLHAAGVVGALDRVVRLRRVAVARLAYDDFPAVLRGGCRIWRLRDGDDADDPAGFTLQGAGRDCDDPPPRGDVEGDSGDRLDRGLRLRNGIFHRLLRRQPVRALRLQEPRVWRHELVLLVDDRL